MPTLLLTHPSLASDPQRVSQITAEMVQPVSHQMIDRLASEAVSLPKAHYTGIRVAPSGTKLPTAVVALLADAIIPGGKVEGVSSSQNMDAIMNGFLVSGSDENSVWTKPEPQKVVLLKRRSPAEKTANGAVSLFSRPNASLASHKTPDSSVSSPALSAASTTSSSASSIASPKRAAAEPWTVDVDDGFSFNDVDDDDDIIDEDALLDGDLPDTIKIPTACQPSGKRRRKACKDCTCGLKELELQEEERRRQNQANVVQLSFDDTAEIDFTVPGKTGSCGNCSLGDAFRCDGCPYLGLPPFKEGEMVSIDALGNDF